MNSHRYIYSASFTAIFGTLDISKMINREPDAVLLENIAPFQADFYVGLGDEEGFGWNLWEKNFETVYPKTPAAQALPLEITYTNNLSNLDGIGDFH